MDGQTIVVLCSVTLAAAFLAVRGWRVVRNQRAKCQSHCGGCGRDDVVELKRSTRSHPEHLKTTTFSG